jgi:hypothetical protein
MVVLRHPFGLGTKPSVPRGTAPWASCPNRPCRLGSVDLARFEKARGARGAQAGYPHYTREIDRMLKIRPINRNFASDYQLIPVCVPIFPEKNRRGRSRFCQATFV